MSFYGTSMIFDGIACEEMGLVLYDFDNAKQEETKFSSNLSIQEDRIEGRYRSLFYGGSVNEPLTFTMVLCASEDRAFRSEPLDRWDLQKIASWLTGHTTYKWLHIVQPDMENIRYRCIISDLEAVEVAGNKWGFSCKVTCDSPFAYMMPETYSYTVSASTERSEVIFSESSYNGLYYPQISITGIPTNVDSIAIEISNNVETSVFRFTGLPTSIGSVLNIDCENEVVTNGEIVDGVFVRSEVNPYQYLTYNAGFHFPRFARGENQLKLTGAGTYNFVCEWPVNVGG